MDNFDTQATSQQAANQIRPLKVSIARRMYDWLDQHPNGATCGEMEANMGLKHQTASARLRELSQAGLVASTGQRGGSVVWTKVGGVPWEGALEAVRTKVQDPQTVSSGTQALTPWEQEVLKQARVYQQESHAVNLLELARVCRQGE